MASNVGDKLLWTAVALSYFAACWYVPQVLRQFKESTTVSIPQPKENKPQLKQDAEAAIEPSTLAELAEGPSYNLAASAIRLTVAKFLKSGEKQALLKDLASKDFQRRDRAINAFRLLLTNTALKETAVRSYFTDDATWQALVIALVNLLPEHEQTSKPSGPPPSPIRPTNRPAHESTLLSFVWILIYEPRKPGTVGSNYYFEDAQPVINAGIITRWLKFYPFPCTLPENRRWNFKRRDVCRLLQEDVWGTDDEPMSLLMAILSRNTTGMRQLVDVGLAQKAPLELVNHSSNRWTKPRDSNPSGLTFDDLNHEHILDEDELEEGELIDDNEMMSRLQETPPLRGGRTAGERSLRRRHRQAVVVADAGMPLREENILQRQPTQTELTWEEEVAGRQEEILREGGSRNSNGIVIGRSSSTDENVAHAVDQIAMERIDGIDDGGVGGIWEGPVPPNIDLGTMEWDADVHDDGEADGAEEEEDGSDSDVEDFPY